jgi:hypothetical protein
MRVERKGRYKGKEPQFCCEYRRKQTMSRMKQFTAIHQHVLIVAVNTPVNKLGGLWNVGALLSTV